MSQAKPSCEKCGAPSVVHITSEQNQGIGMRHLCLACAEAEDEIVPREQSLNLAAVAIVIGLFIFLLSATADWTQFGHYGGFGWKQMSGVALAAVLLLIGAISRVLTMIVIAFLIGSLTILADYFAFGSREGFGWQQITGVIFGIATMTAGIWMAWRKR